jgi:hypothetical protein
MASRPFFDVHERLLGWAVGAHWRQPVLDLDTCLARPATPL